MIETKGFVIISKGDPSVGIFDAEWQLTGGFFFDDQKDLEGFRKELKGAFEYMADDSIVWTMEELKAQYDAQEEQLKEQE